jgi:DNA-binding GntR family transcriptional regulator
MEPAPEKVTQILEAVEAGDPQAAEKLLPLVYEELRRLAAAKMAREKPGHTLQRSPSRLRICSTRRANCSS